jgi:hypothetical protein
MDGVVIITVEAILAQRSQPGGRHDGSQITGRHRDPSCHLYAGNNEFAQRAQRRFSCGIDFYRDTESCPPPRPH